MKLFRNLINWGNRNIQILNTILLVIIISQLITYFDIKLISSTIIPIVYLVSVYFIMKTFRETKNRNRMEIGKDIFEKHIKKFENFKIDTRKRDIFRELSIFQRDYIIDYTSDVFTWFEPIVIALMEDLYITEEYVELFKSIDAEDQQLLTSENEPFLSLNSKLSSMHFVLDSTFHVACDCYDLYYDLLEDKGFMSDEQIKLILRQLDFYFDSYSTLCKDLQTNDRLNNQVFILGTFKFGKSFSRLIPINYFGPHEKVIRIKKKLNII
jgi:hypothetical protein